MILQALKNMYPKASEKVLKAVVKDLEKCRGKNMSTLELADWIWKIVTAHTIEEALRITEDDSKPSQVGDESSFAVTEVGNPTGSHPLCVQNKSPYQVGLGLLAEAKGFEPLYRLLGNRISSAGRYNHFDTLPYSLRLYTII